MPNSIRTGNTTLFEDQVSYQCIEGYENTGGPLTRHCHGNSTWSSIQPICSGTYQTIYSPKNDVCGESLFEDIIMLNVSGKDKNLFSLVQSRG